MSKKSRVVWCDRGWTPIYFGFCPDKKAWHRAMRKFGTDLPYPASHGCTTWLTNKDGQECAIVTVADHFKPEESCHNGLACLLVHESAHVWQGILSSMGEVRPSAEFEAYALQNISLQLIGAFCDTRFDLFRKPKGMS